MLKTFFIFIISVYLRYHILLKYIFLNIEYGKQFRSVTKIYKWFFLRGILNIRSNFKEFKVPSIGLEKYFKLKISLLCEKFYIFKKRV